MRPTIIWAIRHGQTASNRVGRIQGQTAVTLDDVGVAQAEALRPVLQQLPWTQAISSDLERAAQTARLALGDDAARLTLDPSLRERGLGELEGKHYSELDPTVRAALIEGVGRLDGVEGGETTAAFRARCVAALEALGARRGERIAVFTHGGVLRHWFAHVVGLSPEASLRAFSTTNASVNTLHLTERGWRLQSWGVVAHLEALGYLPH